LVDPGANSKPLLVSLSGNVITVSLATSGAGAITSTAAQVVAAINSTEIVKDFVVAALAAENSGATAVTALAAAALAGGTANNVVPTLILAEDVHFSAFTTSGGVSHADQAVSAIDSARVITARLPVAPDDVVRANMPGVSFV